jgi:transposase-like protein
MNLHDVAQVFATEEDAIEHLIKKRWPQGVHCIACDGDRVSRVTGIGKTGKQRRGVFVCLDCDYQFSATSGSLFHDSHLPLNKWFMAIALICEAKKGLSALQLSRHLGVQHRTAWYLNHRIRQAMQETDPTPLGGTGKVVEIDETNIGGKSRHRGVKSGKGTKIKVLGMVERSGRIRLQVIPNAKVDSLKPAIEANVATSAVVATDAAPAYERIIPAHRHTVGVHKDELWNHGTVRETRTVEGAFSLLKRGLVGSYHKLSGDHLEAYLNEFCWRYNRREQQKEMFDALLKNVSSSKPLTYKKLTREMF